MCIGGGGGGNNHHGHGGGGGSHLPLWAIFLIVYFSIFTLLFVISLVYYCRTERKNQRAGRSFRPWYAIWKSFCIASGLWIFICLIKLAREAVEKKATKRGHGGSSRPSGRAGFPVFRAGSGAYTKVDEGGGGPHNSTAYNPPEED
ncbi:hypothetical protein PG993_012216 [Apiospora rasikravindrae]|uniref:Transmembrane protein n=1 Tax=Apiospora rasikravindrae TaxID=990691 RepID=A0ABR1S1T0_9PEZI